MNIDVNDVIFVVLGLFFGQIVTRIFIYKVLHPYAVAPYLKKRKMRLSEQMDSNVLDLEGEL